MKMLAIVIWTCLEVVGYTIQVGRSKELKRFQGPSAVESYSAPENLTIDDPRMNRRAAHAREAAVMCTSEDTVMSCAKAMRTEAIETRIRESNIIVA
jgi:hypothetical protein